MRLDRIVLRSLVVGAVALFVSNAVFAGEKGGEQVGHFYGNFAYSIPIEVPVFHGIEPRLALSYSAGSRNGLVGVGWSLSGISEVQLRSQHYLDGQELILCSSLPPGSGASCSAGGHYTTRNESFLKIQTPGDGMFYVYGRDGTRTTLSPIGANPGTYRWGQTQVLDTKGNAVNHLWDCALEDCYPWWISYNGFSVAFYKELRPDVLSFGAMDHIGTTRYRIRSIVVRQGSNLVRAYKLGYTNSTATGRSLLSSVQVLGKDVVVDDNGALTGGTSLPAQTFRYQNDAIANQFTTTAGAGTSWCETPQYFFKTGDFNGDGKTDMLCASYAKCAWRSARRRASPRRRCGRRSGS